LWHGNTLSGKNNPYFIDSACYYGHREIDFSLTFMFGGFSEKFYSAYNKNYPLDDGFENRKPLYMLYHYLNHLNIFGGTYHEGVMNCINHITDNS
jgi:fructosamine-3-kinase